jgi:phospholipase/lecithinase/hemolysin
MRTWLLVVTLPLLLAVSPARAVEQAAVALEIQHSSAAATAVIGGLQEKINAGKATATDLAPEALRSAWHAAFQRLANRGFDAATEAPLVEVRAGMDRAFGQVIDTYRADIIKGGQDAFVPAFFRAQLFERFNQAMGGEVRAVTTNRRAELLNGDSAVDRLIQDSEIVAAISALLEKGATQSETRKFGNRTVGYWPMAIAQPCASCHERNGLKQQVGQFGGATVVIVGR